MSEEPKVVIIGAGAAGISAACRLIEEGVPNVTILEAKNRIGGRLHTVNFGDNVVDLGGQWVHGESQNVVYNLANRHNLLESSLNLNDFEKHAFVNARGELIPLEETSSVWKLYYEISDRASEELKDGEGSYGEYFTKEFYKYLKNNPFTDDARAEEFFEWMQKFDNTIQCSDTWFDVSARGLTEYRSCDGDLLLNWKDRGYKTLFDLLMRRFPNPQKALPVMEKIVFGKEVASIDSSSGKEVVVKTSDGGRYTATQVIFTASLGVLKEQHSTLFIPSLSEKKQLSIKGLNIGVVAKIFLEFPYRWWPEDSAGFGLLWSKEDKRQFVAANGEEKRWLCDVFQFFTVDYQPRLLCGWIGGQSARHMEGLSDGEVKNGVYELLEKFMGRTHNIPRPDHILRSKWYSDPHFRGCYSYRSMETERLKVSASDLAQPIVDARNKPLVLFAGEATHDHYYSTVHGAIETGYREADRILRYYRQVAKSFDKAEKVDLSREEQMLERTRLVIVGAGIAGLAAAKTLEDRQFDDYILLEAQDEIGGRICSIPWNNSWIEAGAQFLHGDQSFLGEFARKHDFLCESEATEGEGIFVRNDGSRVDQRFVDEIDDLVRDTLEDCEKYAYSDAEPKSLENIGKLLRCEMLKHHRSKNDNSATRRTAEEIFDWNVKFLMIDNSCFTLDELSTKHWGRFRFVGGPEHLVFKAGYGSLTKYICGNLNSTKLRLKSAVETIEWRKNENNDDENAIVVTLHDNRQILADCVIVTSSLGYLKENHRKMFVPKLPSNLIRGIDCLGFGLINKIFLDFGESWWEPGTKGFQMLWRRDSDREITFESYKLASWIQDLTGFDVLDNHEGVLLGWVGGRGAYIVEKMSEDEVAIDCIEALRSFLQRDKLPAPKRCKRTKWNANKYVRGAYSHIPTSCDEPKISPAILAEPVWGMTAKGGNSKNVPVIMLAGEATHEHFFSTTHGAYDTGKAQALNFLRHHVAE